MKTKTETPKPYKLFDHRRTERTFRVVVQRYQPDTDNYKTVESFRLEVEQGLSLEAAQNKLIGDIGKAINQK